MICYRIFCKCCEKIWSGRWLLKPAFEGTIRWITENHASCAAMASMVFLANAAAAYTDDFWHNRFPRVEKWRNTVWLTKKHGRFTGSTCIHNRISISAFELLLSFTPTTGTFGAPKQKTADNRLFNNNHRDLCNLVKRYAHLIFDRHAWWLILRFHQYSKVRSLR